MNRRVVRRWRWRRAVSPLLQSDDHLDGVFFHLPQVLQHGVNLNQAVVVDMFVRHIRENLLSSFKSSLFHFAQLNVVLKTGHRAPVATTAVRCRAVDHHALPGVEEGAMRPGDGR